MRHVPVDRDAPAAAYLHARRLVREGEAVALFPEAGISHSLTVRPLMAGVARLAQETGAPVVPVVQWGTQRLWSVGQRPSPRRGRRVDLRFGPALHVPGDADPRAWTATLGRTLATMLDDLQRGSDHGPRPASTPRGGRPTSAARLRTGPRRWRSTTCRPAPSPSPGTTCLRFGADGQHSEASAGGGVRRDRPRRPHPPQPAVADGDGRELWTLPVARLDHGEDPRGAGDPGDPRRPAWTRWSATPHGLLRPHAPGLARGAARQRPRRADRLRGLGRARRARTEGAGGRRLHHRGGLGVGSPT